MLEVDMRDVVAGLVVVAVQSVAGDCLRHHTFLGESIVIGAGKEVLIWMGIARQAGSFCQKRGSEVRALPSGEPQFVQFYGGVRASQHFELQVSGNVVER